VGVLLIIAIGAGAVIQALPGMRRATRRVPDSETGELGVGH
jgi:hypothetical protein